MTDLRHTIADITAETDGYLLEASSHIGQAVVPWQYLCHVRAMLAALKVYDEDCRTQITRLQEALGTIEPEDTQCNGEYQLTT